MDNKIAFWKTIRFKYTLVVLFATLIALAGMLAVIDNRYSHNNKIYEDRIKEREESFAVISDLETQSLRSLAIENTYWDDMVTYISQPDDQFEEEILRAQLDTYQADAVWTYSKDYKLASNTNKFNTQHTTLDLGLNKESLQKIFSDNYLAHFYRATDVGLMEVYGATVHSSADVEHKTPAEGYFFIARILGPDYITRLESATKNQIELITTAHENHSIPSNPQNGIISFTNVLNDEAGAPVADLHVTYKSTAIADLYDSLTETAVLAIGFLIIIFIVIYYVLNRIIVRPLNTIYQSLRTDNVRILSQIENKDTEFGRLASLIIKSEQQKVELIETSIRMKQTQEKLEKRTKEIEDINKLMVDRELRMEELKKENASLIKSKK